MRGVQQMAWLVLVSLIGSANAQSVNLVEAPKPKDCSRVEILMRLTGEQIYYEEGQERTHKVTASAEHRFAEKVLAIESKTGMAAKVARYYEIARANVTFNDRPEVKTLRPDRSLAVAQRNDGGEFLAYSLGGPLTRDECEVLAEHFDTLCLAGLLPGKAVAVGETWKLPNAAVLGWCQFEGLVSHELVGTLTAVKGDKAIFTISGPASGLDLGAKIDLKITATGTYDSTLQLIVALEWKLQDSRSQGPASPGFRADVVVTVKRTPTNEPRELADAALEAVPQGFEAPARLTGVTYHDQQNRFDLTYARGWMVTGQNGQQTILRLLDRGDFIAQATITPWKKAEPGQHQDEKEFKKEMLEAPGFEADQILQEGEITIDRRGWFIYRLSAQGKSDDIKTVQTFFLIAGPTGEQAVIAFTMKETQVSKLAARDLTLVEGLTFPEKK